MKKKIMNGFVRQMDHVVWKIVDGKGILLNLDDGAYFDVDPVGLTVWRLCDGKKRLSQIALKTSKKFKAKPERVEKDIRGFVSELKRRRLVEIVPNPIPAAARS